MPMTSKPTVSTTLPTVLTHSEKDILQMIAEGYGVEEISVTLALSESEIESQMQAVEAKLGAQNRLHAVTIAVLNGHISIGPEHHE